MGAMIEPRAKNTKPKIGLTRMASQADIYANPAPFKMGQRCHIKAEAFWESAITAK